MTRYSIEPRTTKYVKGYGVLSFATNLSGKNGKQLLNTGINASKKVIHKAGEASGEVLGNRIGDKIVKTKPIIDEISRNVEKIIIPPEKSEELLNQIRQVL